MAATFLLLELLDPEVSAFLWSIRSVITGQRVRGAIHVTLRGPYENELPVENLESWQNTLGHDVLRIAGIGRFSNRAEEVVFFKVDSPHLRAVWWKPSYPIERFGFEPHISIYRGPDRGLADFIAGFLRQEGIELLCAEHRLVWHRVGQPNMFVPQAPSVAAMQRLYEAGRIDATILERLQVALHDYKMGRHEAASTRQGHR